MNDDMLDTRWTLAGDDDALDLGLACRQAGLPPDPPEIRLPDDDPASWDAPTLVGWLFARCQHALLAVGAGTDRGLTEAVGVLVEVSDVDRRRSDRMRGGW